MEAPKYGATVTGLTIVCCKTTMLTAQSIIAAPTLVRCITAIGRTFKVLPLAKLIGQPKYWPDNHTGAANNRPITTKLMENTQIKLNDYQRMIVSMTGCAESQAAKIEDVMRNIILNSTLSWLSKAQFKKAAKEAVEVIEYANAHGIKLTPL